MRISDWSSTCALPISWMNCLCVSELHRLKDLLTEQVTLRCRSRSNVNGLVSLMIRTCDRPSSKSHCCRIAPVVHKQTQNKNHNITMFTCLDFASASEYTATVLICQTKNHPPSACAHTPTHTPTNAQRKRTK